MGMNDVTGGADAVRTAATPWYALWTRSRHEKVVRAKLDELGIEVFLPMVARWNRWHDRTKQIDAPLFPGYCFARFDVRKAKPVLGCAGVVAIVGTTGVPSAISEEEIGAVRRLLDTGLSCDPCPFIKEGMPVVVTHGPLKGVSGRLVCKGPHAWLMISIELIGRAVSVRIHAADVQAA
jgi:transcription antitermination factor NusG